MENFCRKCGAKFTKEDEFCSNCGKPRPKPKRCFIATTCYGTNSEEVRIFQNWRDNTLSKTGFGRKFVDTYYAISPPIADFISNKPLIKRIVRAGLSPLKELIK